MTIRLCVSLLSHSYSFPPSFLPTRSLTFFPFPTSPLTPHSLTRFNDPAFLLSVVWPLISLYFSSHSSLGAAKVLLRSLLSYHVPLSVYMLYFFSGFSICTASIFFLYAYLFDVVANACSINLSSCLHQSPFSSSSHSFVHPSQQLLFLRHSSCILEESHARSLYIRSQRPQPLI